MAESVAPLTASQLLALKQVRGLLYIALEELQDRIAELDELLQEIEGDPA